MPYLLMLAVLLLSALPARAQVVVFADDFDTAIPDAVDPGLGALEGVQGYASLGQVGNRFGGNFLRSPGGSVVTLTLTDLPAHTTISVEFLFAAIDSLDGTGDEFPIGDFFAVRLDGTQIFRESFANAVPSQIQSYVPPTGVQLARHRALGFTSGDYYADSAYDLGADARFQDLPHVGSSATFTFQFEGPGIQLDLDDESWAMDNLRVVLDCFNGTSAPVVSLTTTDAIATEGTPPTDIGQFTLSRAGSGCNERALVVILSAGIGTDPATEGTDYLVSVDGGTPMALPTTVTIPARVSSIPILIVPNDDTDCELSETVTISISPFSSYTIDTAMATGTLTILDDEPPCVSIGGLSHANESGPTSGGFSLIRAGGGNAEIIVTLHIGASTATYLTDYSLSGSDISVVPAAEPATWTGTARIPAGDGNAVITLTPVDDTIGELTESVLFTILDPTTSAHGRSVNIFDNDAPLVSITAYGSPGEYPDPTIREDGKDPTAGTMFATPYKSVIFELRRAGGTINVPLTVQLEISGSATLGSDYSQPAQFSLLTTIPANASNTRFSFYPLQDSERETIETVTVSILDPTDGSYIVGARSATMSIFDDTEPTEVSISALGDAGESGPGGGAFKLTRKGVQRAPLVVNIDSNGSTAANHFDYVLNPNSPQMAAYSDTSFIHVDAVDDSIDEDDEHVTLTVAPHASYRVGTPSMATVTILDDDLPPTLTIRDTSAQENGFFLFRGLAVFTVHQSVASERDVSVSFETRDGRLVGSDPILAGAARGHSICDDGTDFINRRDTLIFPANEPGNTAPPADQSIKISICGDRLDEYDETFFVKLSDPEYATILGTGVGSCRILDDDPPPTLMITGLRCQEGNSSSATLSAFDVSLSAASEKLVTVDFATISGWDVVGSLVQPGFNFHGSATAGQIGSTCGPFGRFGDGPDFINASGRATFAPGITHYSILVEVCGDTRVERDESFTAILSNEVNANFSYSFSLSSSGGPFPVPVWVGSPNDRGTCFIHGD